MRGDSPLGYSPQRLPGQPGRHVMANALRKGLKVQVGQESAWGTAVAATAIMAGLSTIRYKPDDTVSERDELNGILTKTTGSPDILGTAGGVYTGGYMSYQDVL